MVPLGVLFRCPSEGYCLTLEPFQKLLSSPVFWGPFGPKCSYGLPIHEYVTYLATDVLETLGMVEDIKN